MTPEETLESNGLARVDYNNVANTIFWTMVLASMKEYARQMRDKALDWAAENAKTKLTSTSIVIDKESILSGKTHKDLHI